MFSSCKPTVDTVDNRWSQCELATVTNGTNGSNGIYETNEPTPFDEQEDEES